MVLDEYKSLVGQTFGELLVISLTKERKNNNRVWLCLCSCGNQIRVSTNQLSARDRRKHCGCKKTIYRKYGPRINLIGLKFGRLKVIDNAGTTKSGKEYRYKCLCDCGSTTIVTASNLRGNTKSCGCLKKENISTYNPTDKTLLHRLKYIYERNAKRKNIEFNLTEEEFKNIIYQNCFYCKITPYKVYSRKDNKNNNYILFNGIDRKNNLLGYNINNCVPCCEVCNRAKSDMKYDDFISYINRFKKRISSF